MKLTEPSTAFVDEWVEKRIKLKDTALNASIKCKRCDGKGQMRIGPPGAKEEDCEECFGTGSIQFQDYNENALEHEFAYEPVREFLRDAFWSLHKREVEDFQMAESKDQRSERHHSPDLENFTLEG